MIDWFIRLDTGTQLLVIAAALVVCGLLLWSVSGHRKPANTIEGIKTRRTAAPAPEFEYVIIDGELFTVGPVKPPKEARSNASDI